MTTPTPTSTTTTTIATPPTTTVHTTPTITTSSSTTTSTTTTSTGRPPAESPTEVLRQLIHEVKLAKLPRHLRHELLALLEETLHGLRSSGFGASAGASRLAFQQDWRLIQAPFATLSTHLDTVAVGSQHAPPAKTCNALGELIGIVQADQRSHRSKIPGGLARELIQSARSIGAQVGCGSLSHGHSSKHPHGRSCRQQRHR